jgi:hypothetical protein
LLENCCVIHCNTAGDVPQRIEIWSTVRWIMVLYDFTENYSFIIFKMKQKESIHL